MCLLLIGTYDLFGVPAYPGVVEVTQPDGTVLKIKLHGDEYFSYATTDDGYLLKTNAEGVYEYAYVDGMSIKGSGVKAQPAEMRTQKDAALLMEIPFGENLARQVKAMRSAAMAKVQTLRAQAAQRMPMKKFPLSGQPKSIVILANFSDIKFTVRNPQEAYTRLLNESGYDENGGTGSARDYFIASSDSLFQPEFVVVGPVDLPQTCEFYGKHVGENDNDENPQQMVIDACNAAARAGLVNFADYDTDGDGTVDNVFIYYAGHNEAEGGGDNTIWPHRSRVYSGSPTYDGGVQLGDYACTSEYRGGGGSSMCGIGTFCHEFGHVLGLPDLYVTDYSSNHATPETWDIMDHGSYNNNGRTPPTYSSYERFFLGWSTPVQLTEPGSYELEPLVTSGQSYLVAATEHNMNGGSPNPREFFMIENRQRLDMDEYGLPGTGLLVWHIRYNPSTWNSNDPNNDPNNMGVDIVRARKSPVSDWAFPSEEIDFCQLELADGTLLEQLSNIVQDGDNMTFLYAGGGEDYPNISVINRPNVFVMTEGDTSAVQILEVAGRHLPSEVTVSMTTNNTPFYFRLADTDDEFVQELKLEPQASDSSLYKEIEVMVTGATVTHNIIRDAVMKFTCDSNESITFSLPVQWQVLRPVYVVPPVAYEAENVTPYSFVGSWDSVWDASLYYFTLYTLSDESGELVENFDAFDEETPIEWQATFNRTNSTVSESGKAAYFSEASDTIVTEEYFMAATGISFWLSGWNAVGVFTVEANSDTGWVTLEKLEVENIRSSTLTYDFTEGQDYRQFRFSYLPASGSGGAMLDNFTFRTAKKMEYIYRQTNVMEVGAGRQTDTVLYLGNLKPEVNYYYKVQATDQTYNGFTGALMYDNITDYSNTIEVKTLATGIPEDLKPKHKERWIAVSVRPDGSGYVAYVPEVLENHYLYIYTINGSLVASVPVTSNEIVIPQLTNGQVYIIKYSAENDIKRKDKYAKFFYNIN